MGGIVSTGGGSTMAPTGGSTAVAGGGGTGSATGYGAAAPLASPVAAATWPGGPSSSAAMRAPCALAFFSMALPSTRTPPATASDVQPASTTYSTIVAPRWDARDPNLMREVERANPEPARSARERGHRVKRRRSTRSLG